MLELLMAGWLAALLLLVLCLLLFFIQLKFIVSIKIERRKKRRKKIEFSSNKLFFWSHQKDIFISIFLSWSDEASSCSMFKFSYSSFAICPLPSTINWLLRWCCSRTELFGTQFASIHALESFLLLHRNPLTEVTLYPCIPCNSLPALDANLPPQRTLPTQNLFIETRANTEIYSGK